MVFQKGRVLAQDGIETSAILHFGSALTMRELCLQNSGSNSSTQMPWCITLDNSKGISRLRFWAKNRRVNGINDLPVFMHQGSVPVGAIARTRLRVTAKILSWAVVRRIVRRGDGRCKRRSGGHPFLCQNSALWCLRCLLLVMCTHPFAKEALTLHLARSEGHELYFGCN